MPTNSTSAKEYPSTLMKDDTFCREVIDVGRVYLPDAVGAELRAQIVNNDEQDVGVRAVSCMGACCEAAK